MSILLYIYSILTMKILEITFFSHCVSFIHLLPTSAPFRPMVQMKSTKIRCEVVLFCLFVCFYYLFFKNYIRFVGSSTPSWNRLLLHSPLKSTALWVRLRGRKMKMTNHNKKQNKKEPNKKKA